MEVLMDNQLADFFTRIGFKIDQGSYNNARAQMAALKKEIDSTFSSAKSTANSARKASPIQKANERVKVQGKLFEASAIETARLEGKFLLKKHSNQEAERTQTAKWKLAENKSNQRILEQDSKTSNEKALAAAEIRKSNQRILEQDSKTSNEKVKSAAEIRKSNQRILEQDSKTSNEKVKSAAEIRKSNQRILEQDFKVVTARKLANIEARKLEQQAATEKVKSAAEVRKSNQRILEQDFKVVTARKLANIEARKLEQKAAVEKVKSAAEVRKWNAKTKHVDALTQKMERSGALSKIQANNVVKTIRARVVQTEAQTAKVAAQTALTESRNRGKLYQQQINNESRAFRERMANVRHNSPLRSGGSNAMTTGAVGGMTARGAIGSIAAGGFAQQAFKVAQFTTARMPQFEFLTGSKELAKEQIAFIDKEVDRLSLNLGQANEQYKNLLAGGSQEIGIKKTQELFTSFSEISTMLNTSPDQQNRGLRAFTQINLMSA
jgi:myosin heavy subunit